LKLKVFKTIRTQVAFLHTAVLQLSIPKSILEHTVHTHNFSY